MTANGRYFQRLCSRDAILSVLQTQEDLRLKYNAPEELEDVDLVDIAEEPDVEGEFCVWNLAIRRTQLQSILYPETKRQMGSSVVVCRTETSNCLFSLHTHINKLHESSWQDCLVAVLATPKDFKRDDFLPKYLLFYGQIQCAEMSLN